MKEFVERCVITFRWWREDRESLHSSVLQDLEVLAYERINKMKVNSSRECLLIATRSAYARGWSSPVNLAIYRRSTWRLITEDRKLP